MVHSKIIFSLLQDGFICRLIVKPTTVYKNYSLLGSPGRSWKFSDAKGRNISRPVVK